MRKTQTICCILASYLFIPPFHAFPLTFHVDVVWSNVVFCAEEIIVIEAMYRQRNHYVNTADLLEQLKVAQQELAQAMLIGYFDTLEEE